MALCTGDRHTALSACVRHAEDIIMQLIHQSLVYLHIITGIGALLLFWIPVIARKGSHQHKRVGRWFASLMYAVGISGVVLSSWDLLLPTHFHQDFPSDTAVRDRAMFLLSLSLLVLTSTRHGWLTISYLYRFWHSRTGAGIRHAELCLQKNHLATRVVDRTSGRSDCFWNWRLHCLFCGRRSQPAGATVYSAAVDLIQQPWIAIVVWV